MIRIIPRLDLKGPNLVKGINLEGLRVLGIPNDFALKYYEDGADEIIFQDVVASLYSRDNLYDVISKSSKKIFIPITAGGGVKSIEDISKLLRSGADRVSINTEALKNPDFIKIAISKFGSSTIVSNIEAVLAPDNNYYAFTDNGRNNSNIKVIDWVEQLQNLKIGEIILTFVDTDGTGKSFDIDFINLILNKVSCPVTIHGGIGDKNQVLDIINKLKVSGVGISSLFHYYYFMFFDHKELQSGNTDFIKRKISNKLIKSCSIKELKNFLKNNSTKKIRYE